MDGAGAAVARRPRIGVTGNARRWAPAWWCTRLALALVGARAVRISVRHQPAETGFAGLVIGGGNDISPEHYGGDVQAPVRADSARDALEMRWIRHAVAAGIPLLGICRGAQLINVVLGGNLHQDVRPLRRRTRNRPGLLPTKTVHLVPGSTLAAICGAERLRVNSLHHQAIDRCGNGLRVSGRDLDELVQGVESAVGQPVLGVQWHPEYLWYLPRQRRLFRWLSARAVRADD